MKHFLLLISALLYWQILPAQAEANGQFGRLFSKPAERSNLNMLRQNQKLKTTNTPDVAAPEVTAEPEAVVLPDPITLQGYVKRSDGKNNTLWINGQPVQENSTVDNVKIGRLNKRGFSKKGASTEGVDVSIPANGKHIRLKAGQMYAPEDNKIYEMQVVEKAKRLNLEQSGEKSSEHRGEQNSTIDDNASNSAPNHPAE